MTPLELAALLSAVSNGGTLYYLQYPQSQTELDKFVPRVKRKLEITSTFPRLSPDDGAVEYGTARRSALYDPEAPVCGKTGTCTGGTTHLGWFGSFNDYGRYRLVLVVLLTGGRGVSGPTAAQITGNIYRNLQQAGTSPSGRPSRRRCLCRGRLAASGFLAKFESNSSCRKIGPLWCRGPVVVIWNRFHFLPINVQSGRCATGKCVVAETSRRYRQVRGALARYTRKTTMNSSSAAMGFQEIVEAEGHLIDSHVMEQIFDAVVENQGRFEVEEFRIGRTNSEPSQLRLRIEAPSQELLDKMLGQLHGLGCSPTDAGDASLTRSNAIAVRRKISIPRPITTRLFATSRSGSKWRTAHGRAGCGCKRPSRLPASARPVRAATALWRGCAAFAWCRNRRSATAWRSPSWPTEFRRSGRWKPRCARLQSWCGRHSRAGKKVVVVAGPVVVHTGGVEGLSR